MFIQVIVVVSFLMCVNLQKIHLADILEINSNVFHITNENIHRLINHIFTMLKLKSNFTEMSKINLLLIMHSDLNNIAEKMFNTYEELRNITKVERNNKIINSAFDMLELLDEVLKESDYNNNDIHSSNNTMEINNNSTTINYEDARRIIEMKNETKDYKSLESLEILKDFIEKINNLTVNDIVTEPLNEINDNYLIFPSKQKLYRGDLKLWDPPTSAEKAKHFNETFSNRRIYKGKNTKIKKYPFLASIHVMNQFTCAGSIISKDLVITAASCLQLAYHNRLFRENPNLVFIRVGSDYTKRFGEMIPVIDLYFHPSYDPTTLRNNLVIIRMTRQLRFSKKKRKIRRIEYDTMANRLPDNVDGITILGWGAADELFGVKDYQQLSVADIDIYNTEECQDIYSKHYVSEKNFCAGYVSKGGGACNRDVGGPGIVGGMLMGVISFGPPVCGAPDAPTVFTKLGYYAQWIDGIMKTEPPIKSAKTTTATKRPINIEGNKIQTKFTINPIRHQQDFGEARSRNIIEEYAEEIQILNQLLNDIVLRNNSIVDELLYADLNNNFDDIFKTTQKDNLLHHPLVNKSIYMFPEVHTFGNDERETEAYVFGVTTPNPRPIHTTNPPDRDSAYLLPLKTANAQITYNKDITLFNDKIARYKEVTSKMDMEIDFPQSASEEKESESLDGDDISNNYEESDNDSDEGLSIDITETKTPKPYTKLQSSTARQKKKIRISAKHEISISESEDSSKDIWDVLNTKRTQHQPYKLQNTPKRFLKPSEKPELNERQNNVYNVDSQREQSKASFDVKKTSDSNLEGIVGRTMMISDEEYNNHERDYKRAIDRDRLFSRFYKYY